MQYSDIQALVQGNTGRTDKADLIKTAINLAYTVQLPNAHSFSDLRSTVTFSPSSGDGFVTLASGTKRVVEARAISGTSDGYPIEIRSPAWIKAHYPNQAELGTGKVVYGWVEGGKFYLLPKTDGTYQVVLTTDTVPTALSDDTDEPVVLGCEGFLVAWSSSYVFKSIQMLNEAKFWMNEAIVELGSLMRADANKGGTLYKKSFAPQDTEFSSVRRDPTTDPFNSGRASGFWNK